MTNLDRSAATVAILATACATAWIAFNVLCNYDGHLSGLFYTGSRSALPAEMVEHTYRVTDPSGYDGQFYHLIAHDPLLQRGFSSFVDNPPLRWRRIGVPGLAALLSAGNDQTVDFAYVTIQLAFVALGAYWLARYAQHVQLSPAWGLSFLLIPAVMVSLDRMTVDLALAALTIGVVVHSAGLGNRWPAYLILCLAPLVRETGILLVAAWCLHSALKRKWRESILSVGCAVPALSWWTYLRSHTVADGTHWLAAYPFSGIVARTVQGGYGPNATLWLHAASIFERLALAGVWSAFALSIVLAFFSAWQGRSGMLELTAIAFVAFAASLGRLDIWESAYAAGRTMSPLLVMLGMIALRDRRPMFAVPMLLVLPRIALQYEAQIRSAFSG